MSLIVTALLGCQTATAPSVNDILPASNAPVQPSLPPTGSVPSLGLDDAQPASTPRVATADTCADCHDASVDSDALWDEAGHTVAPYDLWQGSMMANAARDPLWRAVVSAEMVATPAAADVIQQKCMRCHAPLASVEQELLGEPQPTYGDLDRDPTLLQLGLDGVSCTLCHQIEPDGLGTDASHTGGFFVAGEGRVYAPHDDLFAQPMTRHSGYTPEQGDHLGSSDLCATCHTLTTQALDADANATGGHVLEQATALELANSDHADRSCQDCHLPKTSEAGEPLSTPVAHNPGGRDFPRVGPREAARHLLVGGNTLIPTLLRDNPDLFGSRASTAAFDATLEATRRQLREDTAQLQVTPPVFVDGRLQFDVAITVHTGHKFPSGIPVRRAWLRVDIQDASGSTVWTSGQWNDAGQLIGPDGILPEERAGGPLLPHVDTVRTPTDVVVYQGVLADGAGQPTFTLLRGEGWAKDNRLLPAGFDLQVASADHTAPVGVSADADFTGGGDTVHFDLDLPEAPVTVHVSLVYQPVSARFVDELIQVQTADIEQFAQLWDTADRSPELVATATVSGI